MQIWTSTDFEGHYPVGTAAVVVAPDPDTAMTLLAAALKIHGLPGDNFSVEPIDTTRERAHILLDGDY